jgi:hypothetical protein
MGDNGDIQQDPEGSDDGGDGSGDFQMGRPEVEAIARTLGTSLTRLSVWKGTLAPGFWAAVDQHLPGLQSVYVGDSVMLAVSDLSLFCGARVSRPMKLQLGKQLYQLVDGDRLAAAAKSWGDQRVSVTIISTTQ